MARKILIATHGYLAGGFKSVIEMLAGCNAPIEIINAYTDDEPGDYTPRIVAFVESVGSDDEGVIFTDITGGSVNQKVMRTLAELPGGAPENVFLVTESNLMAVLGVVLECRPLSAEVIDELVGQTAPRRVVLAHEGAAESGDADAFLA